MGLQRAGARMPAKRFRDESDAAKRNGSCRARGARISTALMDAVRLYRLSSCIFGGSCVRETPRPQFVVLGEEVEPDPEHGRDVSAGSGLVGIDA